jgi:ferredoxin-thioredoxin reductase catalytic subunit
LPNKIKQEEYNMFKDLPPQVRFNDDGPYVEKLLAALEKKAGYCPCRLLKKPENICICQEFRDQISDENFEGFCHCKLFFKEKKK